MDPNEYKRSSADEAYYDTAAKRENFHLIAGHQATRIMTSANSTVKATGVEVRALDSRTKLQANELHSVCCLKERNSPVSESEARSHPSCWIAAHAPATAGLWDWRFRTSLQYRCSYCRGPSRSGPEPSRPHLRDGGQLKYIRHPRPASTTS